MRVSVPRQPIFLGAPIDVALGLEHVRPTAAEAEVGPPIDSIATMPARMNRSAQLMFLPHLRLTGHSSRRALSRLPLSGQLLSGAKRCCPLLAPPRPSPVR